MLIKRNYLPINLQTFSEEVGDPGVEVEVSAAEGQEVDEGSDHIVETTEKVEEPVQNNFEKAFAKRLSAERDKWEADRQRELEQYKDYDALKKVAEYVQRTSGFDDVMSLKEQIELAELQERAEQNNVPPEVMRRLEELESKATRADQYEQEKQYQEAYKLFRQDIEKAVEGTDIPADDLDTFMKENDLGNIQVALKAMKSDRLEKQLENAEKEAYKKFLAAKGSIPTVEGKAASGTVSQGTPKTLADAKARAAQRLSNWGNMEG